MPTLNEDYMSEEDSQDQSPSESCPADDSALSNKGKETDLSKERSDEENQNQYKSLWNPFFESLIDDHGRKRADLVSLMYKKNKIILSGPPESKIFYLRLSALVIDYIKVLFKKGSIYLKWLKIPKNRTEAKRTMFNSRLSMRKLVDDKFVLLQDRFL
eukprot:CAMPEP_0172486388 /NCGR_PEP_ID=MMETSP1066-20121228/14956_1 /TAXON_ID=671091 /ORGANISM="Coscinodiscus wailesii, Strain CCMP2513" /LENGTH=157 /DNA_ID=CAMNT_0013252313 /DNA_START=23 /DNA_END=496 /DNA_ORIENTATION=-